MEEMISMNRKLCRIEAYARQKIAPDTDTFFQAMEPKLGIPRDVADTPWRSMTVHLHSR